MYNYFTNRVEAFDVEMGNSSSELIDYFLKRSQRSSQESLASYLLRVEFPACGRATRAGRRQRDHR